MREDRACEMCGVKGPGYMLQLDRDNGDMVDSWWLCGKHRMAVSNMLDKAAALLEKAVQESAKPTKKFEAVVWIHAGGDDVAYDMKIEASCKIANYDMKIEASCKQDAVQEVKKFIKSKGSRVTDDYTIKEVKNEGNR